MSLMSGIADVVLAGGIIGLHVGAMLTYETEHGD